jgi:cytochrome b subunit of formate dehydrogenase
MDRNESPIPGHKAPYYPGAREKHYIRLNRHERTQHHITWTTFLVLAVTGFMVEFPEEWLELLGNYKEPVFYWRGLLHRIGAGIMIANLLYQMWYIFLTKTGRSLLRALLPRLRDAKDFGENMVYYLGFTNEKPLFDRFNYKEKLEYWTGWIGNIIITLTGFVLWFEQNFPKLAFDVSLLVHTMEAILASSAIMVWHFYEVHLKPGKFPMSKIWLDGKISEHELEEEHPLEYQRIKEAESSTPTSDMQ